MCVSGHARECADGDMKEERKRMGRRCGDNNKIAGCGVDIMLLVELQPLCGPCILWELTD